MKLIMRLLYIAIFLSLLIIFSYWQNNDITVSYFKIKTPKVHDKIRIVQLSDLHGKEFGQNNSKLIDRIKALNPDIIAFTGDLIDRNGENIKGSVKTLSTLNTFAEMFYVPGNHEYWSGKQDEVFSGLKLENIKVLKCDSIVKKIKNTELLISGFDDQAFSESEILKKLQSLKDSPLYKIILSHYPENFQKYSEISDVNLMFCGHAHGGQFILPFIGGVYAPGQGFFPKYYTGLYQIRGCNLIVNRGLGNSVIPQRIFNRPEIVVVDLERLE